MRGVEPCSLLNLGQTERTMRLLGNTNEVTAAHVTRKWQLQHAIQNEISLAHIGEHLNLNRVI